MKNQPTFKYNKTQACREANQMLSKGIYSNRSEAFKAAYFKQRVIAQLEAKVIRLTYVKGDGEIVERRATLVGYSFTNTTAGVIKYYDFERQSIRCCRIDRLQRRWIVSPRDQKLIERQIIAIAA